jgi:hypothetical protein
LVISAADHILLCVCVNQCYVCESALRFAYRVQIQLIGMATFSIADPYTAPTASSSTEIDHADLLVIHHLLPTSLSLIVLLAADCEIV